MKSFLSFLILLVFVGITNAQEKNSDSVEQLLEKAKIQAQEENKNIFVKFEASWCGWCKKMTQLMKTEKTQPLFQNNYVLLAIDVLENRKHKDLETPGGEAFLEQMGGTDMGLPYWVILDENGEILENSFDEHQNNLGCPAYPEEVTLFTEKLNRTSSLKTAELEQIALVFLNQFDQ